MFSSSEMSWSQSQKWSEIKVSNKSDLNNEAIFKNEGKLNKTSFLLGINSA